MFCRSDRGMHTHMQKKKRRVHIMQQSLILNSPTLDFEFASVVNYCDKHEHTRCIFDLLFHLFSDSVAAGLIK